MATTKRAAVDMNTLSSLKAERLNYKTPKERARINDSVPVEQRMQIVDERKQYEETDKLTQIHPKFTEDSRTHSVVSSLAFFFGSPVGAELTESGTVEYKHTSQGLIKWRVDEFFTSSEINNVVTAICDVVLSTDDEELIARVHEQIQKSNAVSDRKKKSVNRFFDKFFKFRKANQSRRHAQIRADLLNNIQLLPEGERKLLLQEFGKTATGSVETTNVSSGN
jgi:hypothetical protein